MHSKQCFFSLSDSPSSPSSNGPGSPAGLLRVSGHSILPLLEMTISTLLIPLAPLGDHFTSSFTEKIEAIVGALAPSYQEAFCLLFYTLDSQILSSQELSLISFHLRIYLSSLARFHCHLNMLRSYL